MKLKRQQCNTTDQNGKQDKAQKNNGKVYNVIIQRTGRVLWFVTTELALTVKCKHKWSSQYEVNVIDTPCTWCTLAINPAKDLLKPLTDMVADGCILQLSVYPKSW